MGYNYEIRREWFWKVYHILIYLTLLSKGFKDTNIKLIHLHIIILPPSMVDNYIYIYYILKCYDDTILKGSDSILYLYLFIMLLWSL